MHATCTPDVTYIQFRFDDILRGGLFDIYLS